MTRHTQLKLLFDENHIEYTENIAYCNIVCDFRVDNTYILIAIASLYNMYFVPLSHPICRNYFKNLQNEFSNNNTTLIVIWDWDELDKVLHIFTHKKRVRASTCLVKEISVQEAAEFLNNYHFQKSCRGQSVCLGLFNQNVLLQVMTFGKPRYNRNYEYELLRLCTRNDIVVYGGSNKLFQYFCAHYQPGSVISYCDCSKFNGSVYQHLHFVRRPATPSIHWVRIDPFTHITDNMLRYKGADKLIGTTFGKGTSNVDIMKGAGFLPVPDCGQDTYVYIR